MEEAYWRQFMTTGKIEDYLQFKSVSGTNKGVREQEEGFEPGNVGLCSGEKMNAGIGKCDGYGN